MIDEGRKRLLLEARVDAPLGLDDLPREIPGNVVIEGGAAKPRVLGVQLDSRAIVPGDLFVVRPGKTHDPRAFVVQAKQDGAVAIMAERGVELPPIDLPIVRVPDITEGLAYAAAAVYGHPGFSLDVVGITGTNGKTTTSHLVRAAIDGSYGRAQCGVIGTVGHTFAGASIEAAHTTPEADELARLMALMKKRGATHVAMEVSSIAIVLGRVKAVRYRVAAFTNLTQDHLDFHGSMEAYAAAKMSLFTELGPGLAVVNIDDPFGEKIAAATKCQTLRVSRRSNANADIAAESVTTSAEGMRLRVRLRDKNLDLETRLVGAHNVENLMVALGVVHVLELDVERAVAALATETGAPGRLQRCDGPGDDVIVLVDYAHTPDALGRAIDAVKGTTKDGRVVCVFGCGGDRDSTKRRPMGEAVGARADVAIVTSDNPRTEDPAAIAVPVIEGVRAAGKQPIVELDRAKAIALAVAEARAGDVVLIAGKGHEDYQIIGTEKRPFDDRVEAKRALERRRGGTETRT